MAVQVAEITARLKADIRDFDTKMGKAERRLGTLESSSKTAAGPKGIGGVATAMKGVALVAAAGFGLAKAKDFIMSTVSAASDLEESVNAVQVVFGDASKDVLKFGADTKDSVFIAQSAFNELATVTGSLLQGLGQSQKEAADWTLTLTERAADMASVFNTSVPDAIASINSALKGEANPIEKYGVSMNEAALKAYALENGLIAAGEQMTMQIKLAARLGIIMEQTSRLQGDAANTADSYSNKLKALNEQWVNAQARIGKGLLPVMVDLLDVAEDMIPAFEGIASSAAGVISEVGGMATAVADAAKLMKGFTETSEDGEKQSTLFGTALNVVGKAAMVASPAVVAMRRATEAYGNFAESVRGPVSGWTDAQLELKRELGRTAEATDTLGGSFRDTLTAAELFAEGTRDAAFATKMATKASKELASQMLAMSNPVYNALRAMDSLASTLKRIDEDGTRTAEEMLELAKAITESEAAMNAIDSGNIQATLDLLSSALNISEQAARDLLIQLGILDGTEVAFSVQAKIDAFDFEARVKSGSASTFGSLPRAGKMHSGGVVPGQRGQEVLTVLQAGETVTPLSGNTSGGVTIGELTVNLEGTFDQSDPSAARRFAVQMREELDRLNSEVA